MHTTRLQGPLVYHASGQDAACNSAVPSAGWFAHIPSSLATQDVRRIYNLRKPKTNIQILQQNVLLKHRHLMQFMRRHGRDVAAEVRAAYIETLSRVLSGHFKAYLTALDPLLVSVVFLLLSSWQMCWWKLNYGL